jgi:hypothetical protein
MAIAYRILFPMLSLALFCRELAASDPRLREPARQVRSKYQEAVVTVVMALEDQDGAKDSDNDRAPGGIGNGTILTAEGITVTTLPVIFLGRAAAKIGGIKMVLPNGRTIAAELIGRDDEHRLAFIRPAASEKVKNHPHLKFPAKKTEVDLLDETFLLYRMSGSNRVGVSVCRVSAEGDKKGNPPALDLGDAGAELGLGGPVFDTAGRPLGIAALAGSAGPGGLDPVILSGQVIEGSLKKVRMK